MIHWSEKKKKTNTWHLACPNHFQFSVQIHLNNGPIYPHHQLDIGGGGEGRPECLWRPKSYTLALRHKGIAKQNPAKKKQWSLHYQPKQCILKSKSIQITRTFALFDPSNMINLMIPDKTTPNVPSHFFQTPCPNQLSLSQLYHVSFRHRVPKPLTVLPFHRVHRRRWGANRCNPNVLVPPPAICGVAKMFQEISWNDTTNMKRWFWSSPEFWLALSLVIFVL